MSGTFSRGASPWTRAEFPDPDENRAIAARIPDGYTVRVAGAATHGQWHVQVISIGERLSQNRVVLEIRNVRHARNAIDRAIAWIDEHDTATYAGVEVPVR